MRNKYCYFCKIISQKTESKLLRVKFSNDRALIPCNDNNDLGTWVCSDCIEAFNSYMVRHTVEKAVFNEFNSSYRSETATVESVLKKIIYGN